MELGSIVLILVLLFVAYRIGAIKFAQTASESAISQTNSMLEVMELQGEEKRSRQLGKVIAKLDDPEVSRATAKEVKARFAQGFTTAATAE